MHRIAGCGLIALFVLGCTEPLSSPGATGADPTPVFHGSYAGAPLSLSGWGTAVMDGILSPGEWDGADRVDFEAKLPLTEGGGTVAATVFVMNDDRDLFLAVRVARHRANTTLRFDFDNDHDDVEGSSYVREEGDDWIRVFVIASQVMFLDGFWTMLPPCPPASSCFFADDGVFAGVSLGGTRDGAAAATSDGLMTYVELSHPLDSDDGRDISLSAGATVGFHHSIELVDPAGTWPDMLGQTDLPGPDYRPGWGDIVIASPPPEVVIARLQTTVSALVDDGALREGHAQALLALLGKALEDLDTDRPDLAVRMLRSFVRVVEGLVRGAQLTADLGQPLITDAEQVIAQIEEPHGGPSIGEFTVTDLGTLGGTNSVAHAVNNLGQVVGNSRLANGEEHAFLWKDGMMTDLGTLGGTGSQALGVNDRGQIVGRSTLANGDLHAFLWEDGTMTDLGTLAGTFAVATAINDRGQVVGVSRASDGGLHAFLWERGTMMDLGTLGGRNSEGRAINNRGQVVGYSILANGESHAFLWENRTMTDLGTLGGTWSRARGINDRGQVAGFSMLADFDFHAVLWEDGTMTDLGTLGGTQSLAFGINELGQVVGESTLADGETRAFVWRDGTMSGLGTLGGTSGAAEGVNELGQVVGGSRLANEQTHATLWARHAIPSIP